LLARSRPTVQAPARQAGIVQVGRSELAIEQAHGARFLDADVDAARVGVVAAEKDNEEARGVRDGNIGRIDADCFVGGGRDDGLGWSCVDVEALRWRRADVVVVIGGLGYFEHRCG
jgi:hypothetical protein